HGGDVLQLALVVVEGGDPGPAAQRLEGVAAGAAPQVEEPVAPPEAEQLVVDGEHGLPTFEEDPVLLDRPGRGVLPRPLVDDPLPAGGADGRPQVVAPPRPAEPGGERLAVA